MDLMDVEAKLREVEGWEEKFQLNKWGKIDRKQIYALNMWYDLQIELGKANPLIVEKQGDLLKLVPYSNMIGKQAEELVMDERLPNLRH